MNPRSNCSLVDFAGAYFLRPSGAKRRVGRGGGHGRLGHDAYHGLLSRSETCIRLRQRLRHRRRRFLRRICRRSVLTLFASHKNCAPARGARIP